MSIAEHSKQCCIRELEWQMKEAGLDRRCAKDIIQTIDDGMYFAVITVDGETRIIFLSHNNHTEYEHDEVSVGWILEVSDYPTCKFTREYAEREAMW